MYNIRQHDAKKTLDDYHKLEDVGLDIYIKRYYLFWGFLLQFFLPLSKSILYGTISWSMHFILIIQMISFVKPNQRGQVHQMIREQNNSPFFACAT